MRGSSSAARQRRQALIALLFRRGANAGCKVSATGANCDQLEADLRRRIPLHATRSFRLGPGGRRVEILSPRSSESAASMGLFVMFARGSRGTNGEQVRRDPVTRALLVWLYYAKCVVPCGRASVRNRAVAGLKLWITPVIPETSSAASHRGMAAAAGFERAGGAEGHDLAGGRVGPTLGGLGCCADIGGTRCTLAWCAVGLTASSGRMAGRVERPGGVIRLRG